MLHGWKGSPSPHWQAWLWDELEKVNVKVSFPKLSNNELPDKAVWINEALKAYTECEPDIVITHSLGCTLWFHMCNEKLVKSVKHLLLVAPPRDLSEYKEIASFFPITTPKDLYAQEKLLITSTNDPYLSEEEAKKLEEDLGLNSWDHKPLIDAGHVNSESGYGEWTWVLEWVKSRYV
ncbi:MAG: serine hydrolase family protein [Helicobacteraceae bacterium]|nr:serine hydrolase family protein [Helicobacteraceae bacterium]